MYNDLNRINQRPAPFECYTASDLWTDPYLSEQMLAYHLNPEVDLSSRSPAFIDRSVQWMANRFQVGAQTRIADFGCGPGLYASRLARVGAKVTGIDFSANSIAYAKETAASDGLAIDYINQDYLTYKTSERFDLIIMVMCDFCALSPDQRHRMLRKFHGMLGNGGSVLLDVYSLAAFDQREEAASYEENQLNGFWSPERYFGFLNTFKYEQDKVAVDKYTIIEPSRTRTIYNWLQYFSVEALEGEFTRCGFTVSAIHADVAGAQYKPESTDIAIVANREA
jgi:cyclopropane fatty-acyl-phospholipid synthase-like methyltransferase